MNNLSYEHGHLIELLIRKTKLIKHTKKWHNDLLMLAIVEIKRKNRFITC